MCVCVVQCIFFSTEYHRIISGSTDGTYTVSMFASTCQSFRASLVSYVFSAQLLLDYLFICKLLRNAKEEGRYSQVDLLMSECFTGVFNHRR